MDWVLHKKIARKYMQRETVSKTLRIKLWQTLTVTVVPFFFVESIQKICWSILAVYELFETAPFNRKSQNSQSHHSATPFSSSNKGILKNICKFSKKYLYLLEKVADLEFCKIFMNTFLTEHL